MPISSKSDGGAMGDRNIALLYGFSSARFALILVPVLVPYLQDHVGLNFHEILLGEAAFAAAMVVIEVPSGWLADRWRRKSVLVVGSVFWAGGLVLIWTADGFAQVVAGQTAMGIAASMQSGADSALLYDTLLARGAQSRYLTVESRRHGLALATLAVAAVLAGPIYVWDPNIVFALDLTAFILTGVFAALLHEPPRRGAERSAFSLKAEIDVVWRELRASPILLWAFLFAGGMLAASKVAVWLQQAYLRALDIELIWFGPIAAAAFLIGGFSSQLGPVIDRRLGLSKTLGAVAVIVVCGFALGGLFPAPLMIPLLFVGAAAHGITDPVLKAMVNHRVASDHRATILSMLSFSPQLVFVALSHFAGQFVDRHGAPDGYVFLAVFVACAAGGAWLGLARSAGRVSQTRRQ